MRILGGLRRTSLGVAVLGLAGATLIGATSASAGPAFTQTVPFTYAGTNPCPPGEAFTGTGTLHSVVTSNVSASGNIQSVVDFDIDGLQAVTMSGKKYVVQDTFSDEFVLGNGSASEETFDITAHFIRVGEDGTFILGDDFYEFLRTHITADANGVITAMNVDTNPMPCQ